MKSIDEDEAQLKQLDVFAPPLTDAEYAVKLSGEKSASVAD